MKPFDLKNENYHMGHLFVDVMRQRPNTICQIDAATGQSETNASVLSRSIRLARCMRRFGLQPGAILALGGRNHLDLHIPYYAALLNGLPIVGVDPFFKFYHSTITALDKITDDVRLAMDKDEIKTLFKTASPRVAFCQKEMYNDYVRAAEELELNTKVITFDDGEHSMAKFIEQYDDGEPDEKFRVAIFDLDKIYTWLVSTSGTTGVIKLAAFKHKVWIEKMFLILKIFSNGVEDSQENSDNKMALNLSPIQWISGFFHPMSMPIMRQTKVQTSAPTTTEHVIDIINKYRPVASIFGPSQATSILKSEKECDLKCFDAILLTGSKIDKDVIIEFRKRVRPDAIVAEAYGQTENLGPIFKPNPMGPIGNCGKLLYPGVEVKYVNPETGIEITEPNVPGEIWSKGPCFSEYYNNPEETANVFTEDGWYKTGDILYRDEEGNVFFVERLKMLIKYRNYHVLPTEIEAVVREHPSVRDVGVSCVPHEQDGEHPVACVVRAPGATVTAQEIKDLVASKLSDSKTLRGGVIFMEELPLTSTDKVARGKLKQIVLTATRE